MGGIDHYIFYDGYISMILKPLFPTNSAELAAAGVLYLIGIYRNYMTI